MKKIILLLIIFSLQSSLFCQVQKDSLSDSEIVDLKSIIEVPEFRKCKNVLKGFKKSCFEQQLDKHVKNNFVYPTDALRNTIQGKVRVNFVINKKGRVINISTLGSHQILQKEAKRIFELLPKLKPATLNREPVTISYSY